MSEKANFDVNFRRDLEIIADLVSPGMKVLDLGCGDGIFLRRLKQEKQVSVAAFRRSAAKGVHRKGTCGKSSSYPCG